MNSRAEPERAYPAPRALPGLLVEPSWLMNRLGDSNIRVVDLRDPDAYASGHIPGAVQMDLAELGSSAGGLDNVLLPATEFSDLMASRGISTGNAVVAYDDQWGLAAARLVWALHRYGHGEVALLNGGWDRWREEGGATRMGQERFTLGHFDARPRPDVYATTEWIIQRIDAGNAVLLDTRTPAEFDGGHLPGAIGWDWFNAVPAGSWEASRHPEELRAEWQRLGFDPSDDVVVYCRSGMRAAHTYVMLRNAGFTRLRLYDGSWQAWSLQADGAHGR